MTLKEYKQKLARLVSKVRTMDEFWRVLDEGALRYYLAVRPLPSPRENEALNDYLVECVPQHLRRKVKRELEYFRKCFRKMERNLRFAVPPTLGKSVH